MESKEDNVIDVYNKDLYANGGGIVSLKIDKSNAVRVMCYDSDKAMTNVASATAIVDMRIATSSLNLTINHPSRNIK